MSLFKFITNLFSTKELTEYEQIKKTIKKKGYRNDGSDTFVKESRKGRTMIWITDSGVRIKVYSSDYAESDFLSRPIEKEKLEDFIDSNQI